MARRTGPVGVVEGEVARGDFIVGDAALGACELLAKDNVIRGVEPGGRPRLRRRSFASRRAPHWRDRSHALPQLERRLERVRQARARIRADHNPVYHDVDPVLLVAVERDLLGHLKHLAIDAHPGKALLADLLQLLAVFALAPPDDRRQDEEARPLRHRQHRIHHLLHGLRRDHLPALWAVRDADPREQEAQVVIHLGHRGNR